MCLRPRNEKESLCCVLNQAKSPAAALRRERHGGEQDSLRIRSLRSACKGAIKRDQPRPESFCEASQVTVGNRFGRGSRRMPAQCVPEMFLGASWFARKFNPRVEPPSVI